MSDLDLTDQPVRSRRAWHRPRLEELGNLRDFVRAMPSVAGGKSPGVPDGMADAGNEANPEMN